MLKVQIFDLMTHCFLSIVCWPEAEHLQWKFVFLQQQRPELEGFFFLNTMELTRYKHQSQKDLQVLREVIGWRQGSLLPTCMWYVVNGVLWE